MGLIRTTVGAVLTTLLGVLVGSALSNRAQQRQWSRDHQADACALILRESSNLLIELVKLIDLKIAPAPDGVRVPTSMDWRPWNEALAMIDLVAHHEIVNAAHAIDREFWPVHQQIKRGWVTHGDWPTLRHPIEVRREEFVNVARRHLVSPGSPIPRLTGRPLADDGFWQFRRTDFSLSGSQDMGRPGQPTPVGQPTLPPDPSQP